MTPPASITRERSDRPSEARDDVGARPDGGRPAEPEPRLRDRAHLPVVVAAVGLVTVGAFENRAVTTALPAVARDLGGMSMFGAASAVPAATYLIGASVAGVVADRRGPRMPLLAGVVAAVLAALAVTMAPKMPLFLAARAVAGVAEGCVDIGIAVLIARVLPGSLRARVYAMFATAWVLPSVLGPGVAGVVADIMGWRAVFATCAGATLACVPALWPAIRRPRHPASDSARESSSATARPGRRVRVTVAASTAAALAVCALAMAAAEFARAADHRAASGLVMLVAAGVAVVAFRHLVPPAVVRAGRGAPAVIVVRALASAAFSASGAFLPLMLITTRGLSAAGAGSSLTVTGIFWAVGSNIGSRRAVQDRTSDAVRARIGLSLISIGGFGVTACIAGGIVVPVLLAAWSLAGLGMGLTSNALATALVTLTPEGELGFHQSAASTLGVTMQGLALAGGGCALASAGATTTVFTAISAGGALVAAAGALLVARVEPRDVSLG